MVDDGVPSRGHRTNMMNPAFKCVGIGCAVHKVYDVMVCLDYAGGMA